MRPQPASTAPSHALAAEEQQATAPESTNREVERLAALLHSRYPFNAAAESIEFCGITCDRVAKRLRIPAKAELPMRATTATPTKSSS